VNGSIVTVPGRAAPYTDDVGIESVFIAVAIGFEMIGAVAMIVGFVIALVLGYRSLRRGEGGPAAYVVLRTTLGSGILLGLEVLVAADLLRTITSKPSFEDAAILGLIVLIRTILSMSIQIEIEGVLPWRKALLTSGGQLLGDAVARDRDAAAQARAAQPGAAQPGAAQPGAAQPGAAQPGAGSTPVA
jgi:uncharacterized membrane protein